MSKNAGNRALGQSPSKIRPMRAQHSPFWPGFFAGAGGWCIALGFWLKSHHSPLAHRQRPQALFDPVSVPLGSTIAENRDSPMASRPKAWARPLRVSVPMGSYVRGYHVRQISRQASPLLVTVIFWPHVVVILLCVRNVTRKARGCTVASAAP